MLAVTGILLLLSGAVGSRVFSNMWLLLTDSTNYIPGNSSIFTFEPTQIDSGSGGYWRYGEDHRNYYYFSEQAADTYLYTPKDKACAGLNRFDYLTWCEPVEMQRQSIR
ncbi:hypothetical protein KRX19_02155 [Cardiobacteriaceae bacterium TAE3-ERU3]|nr:hypothetical protein [Cardiobacteriaceae bacterium TAE3-ERU3]